MALDTTDEDRFDFRDATLPAIHTESAYTLTAGQWAETAPIEAIPEPQVILDIGKSYVPLDTDRWEPPHGPFIRPVRS